MSDIAATLKKELTEISEKASRVMRDYSTMTARCEAAEQANNELNSQLMKEAVRADKAEGKLEVAVGALKSLRPALFAVTALEKIDAIERGEG